MTYLDDARALHQELTVVDAHHDIPMHVAHQHKLKQSSVLSGYWGNRLHEGGVNVQVLPVFIDDRYLPSLGMREILQIAEAVIRDLEEDNSVMQMVTNANMLDATVAEGKIASILALEGVDGLGGDLAVLRLLYRLGVRMVALTWERRNAYADGTGISNPGGLTRAGQQAVKEMFAHNVICDVSHLAIPGFWDVMELAEAPIIASHSNARAVCDHPRNLHDDQIKALAETGGVIGLNFFGFYIHPTEPTAERMADHCEHIINLVGIDHVGLGPDFVESPIYEIAKVSLADSSIDISLLDNWIPDCQQTEHLPRFTAVLLERGFSREEIAKILGENFLRVFRQVWQ